MQQAATTRALDETASLPSQWQPLPLLRPCLQAVTMLMTRASATFTPACSQALFGCNTLRFQSGIPSACW